MEEKIIERAPSLTKSEIEVFSELRKKDQETGYSPIKLHPQLHLEILINRRWKFEKYQDDKITDLEEGVYDDTGFSARAYSAELYNDNTSGINYPKMDHVPYPDLDLSVDELKAKFARLSSSRSDEGKQ